MEIAKLKSLVDLIKADQLKCYERLSKVLKALEEIEKYWPKSKPITAEQLKKAHKNVFKATDEIDDYWKSMAKELSIGEK